MEHTDCFVLRDEYAALVMFVFAAQHTEQCTFAASVHTYYRKVVAVFYRKGYAFEYYAGPDAVC